MIRVICIPRGYCDSLLLILLIFNIWHVAWLLYRFGWSLRFLCAQAVPLAELAASTTGLAVSCKILLLKQFEDPRAHLFIFKLLNLVLFYLLKLFLCSFQCFSFGVDWTRNTSKLNLNTILNTFPPTSIWDDSFHFWAYHFYSHAHHNSDLLWLLQTHMIQQHCTGSWNFPSQILQFMFGST
jgi:hypothetical protein